MFDQASRRQFLKQAAIATAAAAAGCHNGNKNGAETTAKSPSMQPATMPTAHNKLNVAAVGSGGKGESDLAGIAKSKDVNIVALCDVDANTLAKAKTKYPGAKTYNDFRKMLEEQKDIDAVTVSTPDHMHAPAAMMAIKIGKHVYVQKPLTHTVEEARKLTLAAREYKVASAMGNQGHSGEGWRVLCEYIWAGAIGDVTEVHCWTNRPIWPQGMDRPEGEDPVPETLNWDAWIGPAPMRPYKKDTYHTFKWRGWWDFGCGALGDMACHIMDGAYWALRLGYPSRVELVDHSELKSETAPKWSILKYHFPARGAMPPCTVSWYDGGKKPARPEELEPERKLAEGDNGSLFIGSKGKMMAGTYGGGVRIIPEAKHQETPKPAQMIPRVKDHHLEWVEACRGGTPHSGNFDYAGPFSEVVLLGNLALRVGKSLDWDGPAMKVTNVPEANEFVRKEYRKGFEV
ncbi:MAG TPA: Gfo/Idh/MocA family oxidoreductase [Tepidisphaeraceae bacterium]|nr:Gfo/Idh/MocA family oxidoreductase [Tepidisphaeraceae bacterium]